MSHLIRRFRAALLRRLASGDAVEAGEVGLRDPYPPEVSQCIGPIIAALHRLKLIERAGATLASRPSRHRTVAQLWRAVDIAGCLKLLREDEDWLASHPEEVAPSPKGAKQLALF